MRPDNIEVIENKIGELTSKIDGRWHARNEDAQLHDLIQVLTLALSAIKELTVII